MSGDQNPHDTPSLGITRSSTFPGAKKAPTSQAETGREGVRTGGERMSIQEKRVLRRKAVLIAEVMPLDKSVAQCILRQGLLTRSQTDSILAEENQLLRVMRFLELLETTGPAAAFEKLCFLLENLGYSWLSDELIVELVCEKGQLAIDWTVMSEARGIVRQRLGSRRRLETEDVTELTTLIATRYQVAKETYLRQEKRLANFKARNKRQLKDNLRELCVQIESAMSEHIPPPDPWAAGGPGPKGGRGVPRMSTGHLSAQEIAELSGGQSTGPGMSNWVGLLKNRIENLTSAYGTVSKTLAAKEKEVLAKQKAEMIAKQGKHIPPEELERVKAKSRFQLPSDSSTEANMTPIERIAAQLNAKEKAAKLKKQRAESSSVFSRKEAGAEAQKPKTTASRKSSKVTISALPSLQNAGDRRKSIAQSSTRMAGSSMTHTRLSLARPKPVKESNRYKDIAIEPEEALAVKNQIRKGTIQLKRINRTMEHMRKIVGQDGQPKDGFRKMEAQYWKARCDLLKKSKALGYYYFLSDHHKDRCEPCKTDKSSDQGTYSPNIKSGGSNVSKYCKSLAFLAYESPSRVIPDLRRTTHKGELVDPKDLMGEKYFLPHEERHASFPQEFNDESCPGATSMPDGRRRCVACASANKDLPNFYDGLLAPHGEHHFYIPPLIASHGGTEQRHREMRKLVSGPPIGQHPPLKATPVK